MTARGWWVQNVQMVLPDGVIRGDLRIEEDRIAEIRPQGTLSKKTETRVTFDGQEMFLMPGFIDLHSDAIEKEIMPRPNAFFPLKMSFYELEKKLAGNGITTIFHSVSLADGVGVRDNEMVLDIIHLITELRTRRSSIRHRVHLRYEVTNLPGLSFIEQLITSQKIDLLSFMDHTPGQGQFTAPGTYENYVRKTYGFKDEEARQMIEKIQFWQKHVDWSHLLELAQLANVWGIRVASHDDDSDAKVEKMAEYGISISEFPVNLEAARQARKNDIHVCVGAPNVVRGKSHSSNLRAMDAIKAGHANIICSDYHPPAMLAAVFHLVKEGFDLSQAVRMMTLHPALALGMEATYGSIETGKAADLILVELHEGVPLLRKTIVGGEVVYHGNPRSEERGTSPYPQSIERTR